MLGVCFGFKQDKQNKSVSMRKGGKADTRIHTSKPAETMDTEYWSVLYFSSLLQLPLRQTPL